MSLTWLRRSWPLPVLRSEVLLALVLLTDRWEWDWACLLPWLAWLWKGLGLAWPGLGRQPLYAGLGWLWERAAGVALVGLGLMWLSQQGPQSIDCRLGMLPVGLCLSGESPEASVEVVQDETGVYHVHLRGEFVLRLDGTVEVYKRLLAIFLGLLEAPALAVVAAAAEGDPPRHSAAGRAGFDRAVDPPRARRAAGRRVQRRAGRNGPLSAGNGSPSAQKSHYGGET